jgi:hypothetical protein
VVSKEEFLQILKNNLIFVKKYNMSNLIANVEMGHLATLHHQRAIRKLLVGLDKLYSTQKTLLEPLPETDIDPGNPESKCPDIILRDNDHYLVPVVIEIATHLGHKTDYKKLRSLIDTTEYGILEGFVLDFEKQIWHKYSKTQGVIAENPSWSDVLQVDLAEIAQP